MRTRGLRLTIAFANLYRRLLATFLAVAGPDVAYGVMGGLARLLYRLLPGFRQRCEAQCRAALGTRLRAGAVPRVAERAFVHRAWNLADLWLAQRWLHRGTYARYGGRIPEPYRTQLLRAQGQGRPLIFVSAYYGPYDLLPAIIGCNGIRATAVYRAHANTAFDSERGRIRARTGCELVPVEQAAERLPAVLAAGGAVAIIADHHFERRGVPVTFLGLPTKASKSVGLLTWRHNADIIVAGIRRTRRPFHFELVVTGLIGHGEWAEEADPLRYITERYVEALERLILGDPTQYLWGHARWGEATAQRLTDEAQT